jgi:hypothetical protein
LIVATVNAAVRNPSPRGNSPAGCAEPSGADGTFDAPSLFGSRRSPPAVPGEADELSLRTFGFWEQ